MNIDIDMLRDPLLSSPSTPFLQTLRPYVFLSLKFPSASIITFTPSLSPALLWSPSVSFPYPTKSSPSVANYWYCRFILPQSQPQLLLVVNANWSTAIRNRLFLWHRVKTRLLL